jgi:hypothetical protein
VVLQPSKYKGSNADQMIWNQDHAPAGKKCDHCQRKVSKVFLNQDGGGILARTCNIHAPQARAEIRWLKNNQVSPVNADPYTPFPRVITQ